MASEVNPEAISVHEVLAAPLRAQLAVIKAELEALQAKVFGEAEKPEEAEAEHEQHGRHRGHR